MSTYNYNISADTSNSMLNSQTLEESIQESSIVPIIQRIDTNGDVMSLVFDINLSTEEQTTLTNIVNSHDGSPTPEETAPAEVKIIEEVESPPFAAKVLSTGHKLFKRVHGVQTTVTANSSGSLELVVPYVQCKITGIEIIGAEVGDTSNFNVYDNAAGTISTIPNLKLNQFGFNVNMAKTYHREESAYDADLIQGMKLEVEFTNSENINKLVCVNFILHELT